MYMTENLLFINISTYILNLSLSRECVVNPDPLGPEVRKVCQATLDSQVKRGQGARMEQRWGDWHYLKNLFEIRNQWLKCYKRILPRNHCPHHCFFFPYLGANWSSWAFGKFRRSRFTRRSRYARREGTNGTSGCSCKYKSPFDDAKFLVNFPNIISSVWKYMNLRPMLRLEAEYWL